MGRWLHGHWQLISLTALVAALWSTPLMLPLKILVVYFHELAHGLAAWLTGGEIVSLTVNPDQGGLAVTRGGSRFWILTAGYLGSLLIGLGLLLAALRTVWDRWILGGLGAVMVVMAILYMRELFALAYCLALGGAFLAMARFLPNAVSDLALRVIGLASMFYVPRDIISDTITRAHLRSDAAMLAELLGGSPQLWGGIWLIISFLAIGAAAVFALGQSSNLSLDRPLRK